MRMYDRKKLSMDANWVPGVAGAGRKEIAGYLAAITAVDDQVGRLLQTLRALQLEENTIVLFSSDHGNMLGGARKDSQTQTMGGIDPRSRHSALSRRSAAGQ